MGQFLPNIRNVFEEIKKYKKKLEDRINQETPNSNDNSNEVRTYRTNLINYSVKETYK